MDKNENQIEKTQFETKTKPNMRAERKWQSDNYWFGMKESDPFFSYMYSEIDSLNTVLISLPKYVFISPEGKIINNQAPSPSDPMFEQELKGLIEKYAI